MSCSKPTRLDPRDRLSAREYIQLRVDVMPPTTLPTGCWEWRGYKLHFGHGQAKWAGYPHKAHRLSYAAFIEEPGDMGVLHKCDNPPCCNPEHLFLGTKGDNNQDAARKGRYALRQGASEPLKRVSLESFWRCLDLLVCGASYAEAGTHAGITTGIARDIARNPGHWTHKEFGGDRASAAVAYIIANNSRMRMRTRRHA